MLDLNIPEYVWICGILILFVKEFRYWCEMILAQDRFEQEFKHECSEDAKDREMSESVKRMFS